MALVTVQRSPNTQSTKTSDGGEADDEDNNKNEKSECFFTGKATALVLTFMDNNPIQQRHAERRLSTDSTRSTNSTQSNNSDIQQHLQSMFNLLRPDETLKMAVKLESHRPNRTRYLVIVSNVCYDTTTATATTTERRNKITRNNSTKTASTITSSQQTAAASATTTASAIATTEDNATATQQQAATAAILAATDDDIAIMTTTSATITLTSSASATSTTTTTNINTDQLITTIDNNNSSHSSSTKIQSQMEENAYETNISEAYEKRLSTCSSNRQSVRYDAEKNTALGDNNSTDGIEESCLLGIDCNESSTIGLVVPILADTTIHLDGDGGFSVCVYEKTYIFKPVSVQAMWSALQTLHKVSRKARENNFYPSGPSHDWLSYYTDRIRSEQSCLNEWNTMDSLESRRPPSPDAIRNKPTAKFETEDVITMKLKEIMMSVDLDEVTSKYIRSRLEELLDMDLGEYKSFIDGEMIRILGRMDAPTEIFDHVYLGSEWNASNLEELQKNGVRHILNVTREIDNFFPGTFEYFNVRVYDDEKTDLLKYWENTYRYITRAKKEGSKVLVHCKMGVSRSASVVIAYAMKAYNWEFKQALEHVKNLRTCIKPNKNFLNQLETYSGMLDAMKNKEKLQRSKSETNLKSTKDARTLPGSEPTPLIQALNHSKSRSAGHGVSGGDGANVVSEVTSTTITTLSVRASRNSGDQKQRRRGASRSSSTSPKSIQCQQQQQQQTGIVVVKQQSQSLENLTPERSVADEPKNVRFPGNNGENYSVTQNQVLHIQKNTPPPPPPPPPMMSSTLVSITNSAGGGGGGAVASTVATSVRNIVHDLETCKNSRKTADDRKTLNLQFGRSLGSQETNIGSGGEESATTPPVWTSSTQLTQTSNLALISAKTQTPQNICVDAGVLQYRNKIRPRREHTSSGSFRSSSDSSDIFSSSSSSCAAHVDNAFAKDDEEQKRRTRKTQSWAATSGASGGIIIIDTPTMRGSATAKFGGSNSSIDSVTSTSTTASAATIYEGGGGVMRTRPRELPTRGDSWGSGDRCYGMLPTRNSSLGSYDTNRFQHYGGGGGSNSAATTSAIFEGQIHELNMSNKTVTANSAHNIIASSGTNTTSTIKRSKQKFQDCTVLKKLCQENGSNDGCEGYGECPLDDVKSPQKRSSNLYRSASAATSITRSRYAQRCNSEETVPTATNTAPLRSIERRSDGSKPLQSDLFSASPPDAYTMSDIENKNTLLQHVTTDDDDHVILRTTSAADDQRISGNVQILKKNFEAKAGSTVAATATATGTGTTTLTLNAAQLQQAKIDAKKGHQSLPSSPVAQHADHQSAAEATSTASSSSTITTTTATTNAAFPTISASSSSSSSCDHNVKGLVHSYDQHKPNPIQHTTSASSCATMPASTAITTTNVTTFRTTTRPHSCHEKPHPFLMQRSSLSKSHDYSESRPPPAPVKITPATTHNITSTSAPPAENILVAQQQHHQQRRLQQHGKTHPLARLSLQKNAAAYNTILFRMLRKVTYSFNTNNNNTNNNNSNNSNANSSSVE